MEELGELRGELKGEPSRDQREVSPESLTRLQAGGGTIHMLLSDGKSGRRHLTYVPGKHRTPSCTQCDVAWLVGEAGVAPVEDVQVCIIVGVGVRPGCDQLLEVLQWWVTAVTVSSVTSSSHTALVLRAHVCTIYTGAFQCLRMQSTGVGCHLVGKLISSTFT
jgi:hypothetical protein